MIEKANVTALIELWQIPIKLKSLPRLSSRGLEGRGDLPLGAKRVVVQLGYGEHILPSKGDCFHDGGRTGIIPFLQLAGGLSAMTAGGGTELPPKTYHKTSAQLRKIKPYHELLINRSLLARKMIICQNYFTLIMKYILDNQIYRIPWLR